MDGRCTSQLSSGVHLRSRDHGRKIHSNRAVRCAVTQLIRSWFELATVPASESHYLVVEDNCCGWVIRKSDNEIEEYLSTHTFYGSQYKYSTQQLQKYGFDVELVSWDE